MRSAAPNAAIVVEYISKGGLALVGKLSDLARKNNYPEREARRKYRKLGSPKILPADFFKRNRRKVRKNAIAVVIDGVAFESMKKAAVFFGSSSGTIHRIVKRLGRTSFSSGEFEHKNYAQEWADLSGRKNTGAARKNCAEYAALNMNFLRRRGGPSYSANSINLGEVAK